MKSDDYLSVLANLDQQRRQAKTKSQARHIDSARRHLTALYEAEKGKSKSAGSRRQFLPLELDLFLQEIQQQCKLAIVSEKGTAVIDDYSRGRQAGWIEALERVGDMISEKIRGGKG